MAGRIEFDGAVRYDVAAAPVPPPRTGAPRPSAGRWGIALGTVVAILALAGGAHWYNTNPQEPSSPPLDATPTSTVARPPSNSSAPAPAASSRSAGVILPPASSNQTVPPQMVATEPTAAGGNESQALMKEVEARRQSDLEAAKLREANEKLQAELSAEKERAERLEKERADADRAKKERAEVERTDRLREEAESARAEKARVDRARADAERLERQRVENERISKEKADKERVDKERVEIARLEKERVDKEQAQRELAASKLASIQAELERRAMTRFFNSVAGRWKRREQQELTTTPPPRSLPRRRVTEEELTIGKDCRGTLKQVVKVEVRDFAGWESENEETQMQHFQCDSLGRLSGEIAGRISVPGSSTVIFAGREYRR